MNARRLIVAYLIVLLAGLTAATQWVAYRLDYHPALGGLRIGGGLSLIGAIVAVRRFRWDPRPE